MICIVVSAYAYLRLHRPETQGGRSGTGCYVEQQQRFLLACHLLQHLPEVYYRLVFVVVVLQHCVVLHLFNVEVRVGTGYDGVELLIGEHGQPLRFDHLEEAPPEEPGLLLDLLVALEVGVGHYEVHLVVAE